MIQIFVLIFLSLSFVLLPISRLYAESPLSPPQEQSGVPSQLKPPSEDLAQLDEVIDDTGEEKTYQIPMILNDSVENHMEYFKTRGRDVFQIWLDRSAKPLPRKIVINYRTEPGSPEYIAILSKWKFPKQIPHSRFRSEVPGDAKRIEFLKVKESQP